MCNNNCQQGRDCTCGDIHYQFSNQDGSVNEVKSNFINGLINKDCKPEPDENFSLVKRLRTMTALGWNPIGDEAADKIQELESELLEQARIIGMSGEREADLLGKIDRLEREIAGLKAMIPQPHVIRELVNKLRDIAVKYHDHQSLRERLAAPVHDVWKTGGVK